MSQTINPQTAHIYVMVTMSAVDSAMSDEETKKIGQLVTTLPVFDGFDPSRLIQIAEECASILAEDGGLDAIFGLVRDALPEKLHETAYAVAVEVAAADLTVEQEEIRLLQLLRDTLGIEKLAAAAIERGARARHTTI